MISLLNKIIQKINIRQFLKFLIVGFINTAIFYLIYYILLQLSFSYIIALTIGTLIGIINSYIWNKFFTFKAKKKSVRETVKFFIVYAVQYLSNLLIIHICVNYLGVSAEFAGLAAIGIGLFISYFGHKFWTFQEGGSEDGKSTKADVENNCEVLQD